MTTLDLLSFLTALGPVLEIEKLVGPQRARRAEVRLTLAARTAWRTGRRLTRLLAKLLAVVLIWILLLLLMASNEDLARIIPPLDALRPLFSLDTFVLLNACFTIWQLWAVLRFLRMQRAIELRTYILTFLPPALYAQNPIAAFALGPALAYAQLLWLSALIAEFITRLKREPMVGRLFPSILLWTPAAPSAPYGVVAFCLLPPVALGYGVVGSIVLTIGLPTCRFFLAVERLRRWAGGKLLFNMIVYLLTIVGAVCLVLSKVIVA